ncbi:uncharacterized protein LOC123665220 [Melitaea cinxia]|uniref:uncharacterized protein LOC123665220 n=1 Tax=Melitaea cinxia TaxID=113334 RepID=UPI001E27082B|nr:uncharacterized protein LOC123665220 [Melitaea cinxia]
MRININNKIITKRYILSKISQIYDPLGLLSCTVIIIKNLLQKLWLLKIGFDDVVPADVSRIWDRFATSLLMLKDIRVPRHVVGTNPARIELHIFCDASSVAYGACVFVRTINRDSSVTVRLYCSKGKVAPLKPVSIPRLELCGALLGARLYNKDFLPLTPAHFLVGRALTAPVAEPLAEVPVHRLTRYQHLEQIRQHFWNRWSKEYISELQIRTKWKHHKADLQPNTMVVIKDDNTHPLKWSLGRIISTKPGKNGISRVADIQTCAGIIRRTFPRICPLFYEDSEERTLDASASKAGGMSKLLGNIGGRVDASSTNQRLSQ